MTKHLKANVLLLMDALELLEQLMFKLVLLSVKIKTISRWQIVSVQYRSLMRVKFVLVHMDERPMVGKPVLQVEQEQSITQNDFDLQ